MKQLTLFITTLLLTLSSVSVSAGGRDDLIKSIAKKSDITPVYRIPPPSNGFTRSGDEWASVSGSQSYPPPPPPITQAPKFDIHGGPGQLSPIFRDAAGP